MSKEDIIRIKHILFELRIAYLIYNVVTFFVCRYLILNWHRIFTNAQGGIIVFQGMMVLYILWDIRDFIKNIEASCKAYLAKEYKEFGEKYGDFK